MNRNGPHGEDVTPGHQGRRDRRFLAWCQARSGRAADNLAGRPALHGAAETTNRFSTGVRPPTQQRSGASLSVLPCANSGVTAVLTVTGLMERPGRNDRPSCDLRMTWAEAREVAAASTPRATIARKCRRHQN